SLSSQEEQKFQYNAKEKLDEFGLFWNDHGARNLDLQTGRWTAIDPLAEKYTNLNPYNFVADNPMNAIDTDGKKIIFINGKIGGGSPQAGEPYWNGKNSSFVTGAKSYYDDNKTHFTSEDYDYSSSAKERAEDGYAYAKANFETLAGDLADGETFKLVTHSMGAAYGEGIAKYLQEKNITVESIVHINPYQAKDITTLNPKSNLTETIDYQQTDDWVIDDLPTASPGDIKGADFKIREKSGDDNWGTRHRSPIDQQGRGFWKNLDRKKLQFSPVDSPIKTPSNPNSPSPTPDKG
ncbi:MAG: hypothetical protein EAZ57_00180, partial [Cytophagales bacterium]